MKKIFILLILALLSNAAIAQNVKTLQKKQKKNISADSLIHKKIQIKDSVSLADTSKTDTSKKKKPQPLPQIITYKAQDSIHFYLDSSVSYFYKKVDLESGKMKLTAGKVRVDLKHSELYAYITYDSLGHVQEKPVYDDGKNKLTATFMKYNFKTKKGFARNIKTEQNQGYLHGQEVKIFPGGLVNVLHGKFTTCNLDHPHYYINLTKAKYIPGKSLITGPFNFVIEDIPLPIGLPFGYFPQKRYRSSGIIQPTFYHEERRGLGLVGGGYYFVINDYADLKVTGDIFTKGSWGLDVASQIYVRYKFKSYVDFGVQHIVEEEPFLGAPVRNMYKLIVQYSQAPKANPTSNFSANVQLMRGNYRQYNSYNIYNFVNNTTASSISYSKRFRNTPFVLSLTSNLTQNLSDSTISGMIPSLNFNMNQIFPFQWINRYNTRAWYHRIGIFMRSRLVNRLRTIKDTIFWQHPSMLPKYMYSGFSYYIPISTSFKIFKYFQLSPQFSYTGRVYFYRVYHTPIGINPTTHIPIVRLDTIWGINHYVDYNFSLSLSTKLYGIFHINMFGIKAIRHILTPSVGFAYKPDFSKPFWDYYRKDPTDTTGHRLYPVVPVPVVGFPQAGLQHSLTFSLNNNFQMKIRNKADTIHHEKIVNLLDRLNISGFYNFAADSLQLSPINISAGSRYGPGTFSFNASLDPYAIDNYGNRINTFEFQKEHKLFRLTRLSFSTNVNIGSNYFKQLKNKNNHQKNKNKKNQTYIPYHYFKPNWNLSLSYTFSLYKRFIPTRQIYYYIIRQVMNATFSISPTPYWSFGILSGFDFSHKSLTSTTIRVYRDLHCWEMSLSITPFGRMRSYYFSIKIKSPMFSFFEFKRQRSWHDNPNVPY